MTATRQQVIEAEVRALRRLFVGDSSELGDDARLALGWLLREGRVFARTDARGVDAGIDALSMAHLEGSRCLVLRLLTVLELDLPGMVMNATARVDKNEVGE